MIKYISSSSVEKRAIELSGKKASYGPVEKLDILEVPDFPSLGRITALRFVEWLIKNPGGLISLPTGKTPEHFIKWTSSFLNDWEKKETRSELEKWGINAGKKPDMKSFHFVQIDEFYPLDPEHENSFAYYIKKFYFKEFGLDPAKALLIDTWKTGTPLNKTLDDIFPEGKVDLALRYRKPSNYREDLQLKAISAADGFCMEYEEKIRSLGGIGFFLGGIGPDGHVGFNISGSDHFSTTRLGNINYETAAAAATDLGGIEISRHKLVITIGLKTITANPSATAIIIAAGESKAAVVRNAIENSPTTKYPATALQCLEGARFYVTKGAAGLLSERRKLELEQYDKIPDRAAERIITNLSFRSKKVLSALEKKHFQADPESAILLRKDLKVLRTLAPLEEALKQRIIKGAENIGDTTFLHTAPHHDDIMLGYLPYILHLVRNASNKHYFATLTSGFTSVSNSYAEGLVKNLSAHLEDEAFAGLVDRDYFLPSDKKSRNRDVYQYLDGVAANSREMQAEGEARRGLRVFIELTGKHSTSEIKKEIEKVLEYFKTAYPGKKNSPFIQKMKGTIREWEEELLWGHLGFNTSHVFHLRLGFYTGDIFTPKPEMDRDVKPILKLIESTMPDVITVALDPEASGPDTHYKILQATSEALKLYIAKHKGKKIRVWGYRNVWFRFLPSEADIFVPVSMNSFAIMKSAFLSCFGSQKSASFPSHEYDGPFCDLAQKVMVEQYAVIKTALGRDFFYSNPSPRIRASRGMVFLKEMQPEEFFKQADELKKLTENK